MIQPPQRKRVLLLGDGRQVHTARWGEYLEHIGYDVLTLSLEPLSAVSGKSEQIHVPAWLPDFIRYPAAVPAVKRLIRNFAPHVVNAHFLPNYGVIAAMAGVDDWVLSTWGSDIMILPNRSAFHRWRTQAVIRRATYITSDADVMTERLIELGAEPDRVLTFPFGVDRQAFSPNPSHLTEAPRILSNRKLEAVYDIETVIDGYASLIKHLPKATLTIGGEGALAGRLQERAGPGVTFVGNVAHVDMPDLLRGHDVYISMARSDTTSVSLLEAMACGLFPVVSDIPANREWIEHGVNGLLLPVGDSAAVAAAISSIWKDPSRLTVAREANLALVARRADWTTNMSVVRDLFARLAAAPIPA